MARRPDPSRPDRRRRQPRLRFLRVLSGAAVNAFMLFVARFFAGISKANTITVHSTLLADTYPIATRGRMYATNAGVAASSAPPHRSSSAASPPSPAASPAGAGPTSSSASPSPSSASSPSSSPNPNAANGRSRTSSVPASNARKKPRSRSRLRSPASGGSTPSAT